MFIQCIAGQWVDEHVQDNAVFVEPANDMLELVGVDHELTVPQVPGAAPERDKHSSSYNPTFHAAVVGGGCIGVRTGLQNYEQGGNPP